MSEAISWLPPGTCFERLDRRLAETVRKWSRAWFGEEASVAPDSTMRDAAWAKATAHPWAHGAWLVIPDDTVRAMGRLALQVDQGSGETAADHATFDAVGADCLAALSELLVRELQTETGGNADAAPPRAATVWKIDCKRGVVRLGVALSSAEGVDLLRRVLPPAARGSALVSPGIALAPLEVALSARLGTCEVTLSELRSLSAGDVLVLDRDLSARLPLAVEGALIPAGRCTVSRDADNLLLEISEPIIGRNT